MRKNAFFILVFTFLTAFIPLTTSEAFVQQNERERIIVTFKEPIHDDWLNDEAIEVHHTFPTYNAVAITVTQEMKQELQQNENVQTIEADSVVTTSGQIIDWGFTEIKAATTHELGVTGKGVKVGIIDSGVHRNHPDLKIAGGMSFVDSSPDYNDTKGHGTHVAGIVGARDNEIGIIGVAPDVELYALKVIGDNGLGNNSDVIQAIEWAVKHELDIINLSITTPEKSIMMESALNNAYERGVLIVAASGNNLNQFIEPVGVLYPARFSSVIAVGSVDERYERARYSHYGNALEFVAPGEWITSTYIPTLESGLYAASSGTSMAAPFVTGVAALYKEAYPLYSNKKIRTIMQANVIDLGVPGRDPQFGYGLIQAPQTVKEIIFPDVVPDAWNEQAIVDLYKEGIISGYPNGQFYPNKEITRAEAITMVSRILEIEGTPQSTIFKDVSSEHFASGYIARANAQGIIAGYPNGHFGPSDSIKRADTAVILVEAFDLAKIVTPPFHDVQDTAYYEEAVHILKGLKIATGFPDGTYQPTKQMTRAEFAVLLAKALEKQEKIVHIGV